jgi:hypothetical protein
MKKFWQFSIGILPLFLLASCGGAPEEQANTPASPAPTTGQAPPPAAPPANAPLPPTTATPDQSILSSAQIQSAGLIPSTKPQDRLQAIKKNRNNPFELMPVPVVKLPAPVVPPENQQSQTPSQAQSGDVKTPGQSGQASTQPGSVGPNASRPGIGAKPSIPAPPNTKEAESVMVFGIIDFPEYPVAIIQAGNEPVAQSVTARTTLRDPLNPSELVAVESIQGNTVSLEQNGQTILKQVGEESQAMPKTGVTPQ